MASWHHGPLPMADRVEAPNVMKLSHVIKSHLSSEMLTTVGAVDTLNGFFGCTS